jgi:hypothetical protein
MRIKVHPMSAPSLIVQTTYAELLERCTNAAFSTSFPIGGTFTSKTINGRRYWYFQRPASEGRGQKYVGPETPELLKQISDHKEFRDDERERRTLVSTLVRSFGLARPLPESGNVVAALSKAGVFRLRGVLVGTIAYQTYSAMLGIRLPVPVLQTGDIDIAQFKNVSVAVEDSTPPVLDVLKEIDTTFRAVPNLHNEKSVSYEAKGGLRVDFLTPNEGPDTDEPQSLPALQTDALPLRFLDYLIHEPEPAVILHDAGVPVLVPAPQRYALHKLIVSRRRREGTAKRDKDIQQAEALLEALVKKRPYELKTAWTEAVGRGRRKKWRKLLMEGMTLLHPRCRDLTLKTVDARRSDLPDMDLRFDNPPVHYDFGRDILTFAGEAQGHPVRCAISREAIDDYFRMSGASNDERIQKFLEKRSIFEQLARIKYLNWPIDEPESVLVKTMDITKLLEEMK